MKWDWQVFLQDTGGGQTYLEWLHVGLRGCIMRAHETAALVDADAQRTAERGHVLHTDAQLAPQAAKHIVECRFRGLEVVTHGQVVLQVAAYLLLRQYRGDAVLLQQRTRPDAR